MIRELFSQLGRLFTWLVLITPWEQGLRVRMGKRVTLLRAGPHLRIPFIDRIYRQSTRRRLCVVPPQTLTTRDGIAVSIASAVGYEVMDIRTLYESLHDAADTITSEVAAIVAQYVGTHDMAECRPAAIEEAVAERMELGRYGLGGKEFYITCFAAVRTLRVITGEFRQWQLGQGIDTIAHETPHPPPRY